MSHCVKKKDGCCKAVSEVCIVPGETERELIKKAVQDDYLVCTCMEVTYSIIVDAIGKGHNTFQKLSKTLGVGTGCSSCVEEVDEILVQKKEKDKKV